MHTYISPTCFPGNIISTISTLLSKDVPASLAHKLHSIPSVSAALSAALATTDDMIHLLQSSLDHDHVCDDVAALVAMHLDQLPHLQGVLCEQYCSMRPRLGTFHVCLHISTSIRERKREKVCVCVCVCVCTMDVAQQKDRKKEQI